MPVITITVRNRTPSDWRARITGAVCVFSHRGGGNSSDQANGNYPSGSEFDLHSGNVECIPQFRLTLAVRDDSDRVQIVERSFRDPLGSPCCTDQIVTLGQAAAEAVATLAEVGDVRGYTLDWEPDGQEPSQ